MTCIKSLYRFTCLLTIIGLSCFLCTTINAQNNRRFFTGDNTSETEFSRIPKSAEQLNRGDDLPASYSLKQFTPVPGFQGEHGTCVAWSTAYAARTTSYCIQRSITDPGMIKSLTFSPNYLYYYVKQPDDNNCKDGAKIEPALKILADKGDLLLSENIPDCTGKIENTSDEKAKNYTIKAYTSLSAKFGRIDKNEYIKIKKSISEKRPVIFSLQCYRSLFNVGKNGAWAMADNDSLVGNHAVCIIGYDDNKEGGSFEILNSWGTDWGNNGFFWLKYDQVMQYGSYALELMDREVYDPNITRSVGDPQIRGNMEFVETTDSGKYIGPMPVTRVKIDAHAEQVEDDNKAVFSNFRFAKNYPGGTTKFKIMFTTNAPAFVYILDVDDRKNVARLFPYAADISPAVNSTNATIYFPLGRQHYALNKDASVDKICVLYSKSALDFDKLTKEITAAPSTVYETIQSLYKERIIPVKNLNFKDDKISFSSLARENELVCFFIDLNHQ
jgi:C1A family cysteine protease